MNNFNLQLDDDLSNSNDQLFDNINVDINSGNRGLGGAKNNNLQHQQ